MQGPLLCSFLLLSLGISFTRFLKCPLFVLYIAVGVLWTLCLVLIHKKLIFKVLFLCVVFLFGYLLAENSSILPGCHISRWAGLKDGSFILRGRIVGEPFIRNNRTIFLFSPKIIFLQGKKYACCGNVVVNLYNTRKDIHYSEELLIRYASLKEIYPQKQPFYQKHKDACCVVKARSVYKIPQPYKGPWIWDLNKLLLSFKRSVKDKINRNLSYSSAGILYAMLLGEKIYIPQNIKLAMKNTGVFHVLVVSGFHVGIVVFMASLIFKLCRIPRRMRSFFIVGVLMGYCFMTGSSVATARATIMATIFIFAYLLRKEPDSYNSWALAGIVILVNNPRQLFDVGFQLSFLSVFSLISSHKYFKAVTGKGLLSMFMRNIACAFMVSFCVWIATAPVILYHFKTFSPVAIIANVIIVPMATIVIVSGFVFILSAILAPALAGIFASAAESCIALMLTTVSFMTKLPYAFFVFVKSH